LDFLKFQILTAYVVENINMCHLAKFCGNFFIFKMVAICHLGFVKYPNFNGQDGNVIQYASYRKIL